MTHRITRHFVTVGERRVHYARAGQGPVVVLLHASPVSFKAVETMQRVYADHFTVLAFDTPGFGLSDPLPVEQPEIEDFADALAETLSVLSIERVAVHGRHTGAQIAVEFAARHPERCSMAITDGFPIFPEEVRKFRPDAYLLPIVPSWEGAHLLWLWYRFREQYIFWPWNLQDQAHRADCDMPELEALHRGVVEFLEAGDGYRRGYASAYRHRGLAALTGLNVPLCFGWRPGDSLFDHRSRVPAGCWSEVFPRDAHEAAIAEVHCLLRHPAQGAAPPAPACQPMPGRSTTDYIDVGEHRLLLRRVAGGSSSATSLAPVVMVHPLPGSSALLEPMMLALAQRSGREVLALDLPGHGESVLDRPVLQTVSALAGVLLSALETLGIDHATLVGCQSGAPVAVEAFARHRDRFKGLILDAPTCLPIATRASVADEWMNRLGSLEPCMDGSHLLRLWHMRRDMAFWWPWFDRRRECARQAPLAIDPHTLTLEIREMVKQPAHAGAALRAALEYPMVERLHELRGKVHLLGRCDDPWAPCLSEAASAAGTEALIVSANPGDHVGALLEMLPRG